MTKTYKVLSVVEPWGDFIARGVKTIEVRTEASADVRAGEDLLIVQTKRRLSAGEAPDPEGRAVALVKLKEIRPFVYEDRPFAKTERFEEGWWAWVLEDLRPIKTRPRVLAAREIYEVPLDLEEVAT
jgi:hypothetical protein